MAKPLNSQPVSVLFASSLFMIPLNCNWHMVEADYQTHHSADMDIRLGTLGTDPKFSVCVTLPRRSIVRERAGSAARQGRCDGCIFMAGIISKSGRRGKRDLSFPFPFPCADAQETRSHALRQCPRISLEIYGCCPRSVSQGRGGLATSCVRVIAIAAFATLLQYRLTRVQVPVPLALPLLW